MYNLKIVERVCLYLSKIITARSHEEAVDPLAMLALHQAANNYRLIIDLRWHLKGDASTEPYASEAAPSSIAAVSFTESNRRELPLLADEIYHARRLLIEQLEGLHGVQIKGTIADNEESLYSIANLICQMYDPSPCNQQQVADETKDDEPSIKLSF